MRFKLLGFLLGICVSGPAAADLFLVKTADGPGFAGPDQAIEVLEKGILPTFAALAELKAKKKIVAGGLPVGSRTLYLIIEADSNDEVDRILRGLPAWGVFSWKVMPLQSLEGRAEMERQILKSLK
ncbi:MAG: muconolactone Delta-isomerase family protein [Gammaproteobacteria bacterium]|nr:muconolactone Delta-isomerase family protein [Gammaproteobacteria bacterium]